MEAMLRVRERVRTLGIELRLGAHWGEFHPITDDVAGIEIHIAARVIGHAAEGELLVTGSVLDLIDTDRFQIGSRKEFGLRDVIPERWYLSELIVLRAEEMGHRRCETAVKLQP
jgi:class 3 adenylate cyclase